MTIHSVTDTAAAMTVMAPAIAAPNAFTHDTPAIARVSTKTHHARNSRWPVFSRAGAAGGADTGCFVWTAIR